MHSKKLQVEDTVSRHSEAASALHQQQEQQHEQAQQHQQQQQLQQKYMHFKFLQQQLEQIAQQVQLMRQQYSELDAAKEAVDEIGKSALNKEILAPIAEGLFMKVRLQDNTKVILNVGANASVEKNISDVRNILENQKQEMTVRMIEGEAVLEQLQQEVMKIYKEIEPHLQSG
ncbi:prefoldin subunit alpha [Candidatus Woesearchaeota archaeon]|nr:prefoldin subunit alpha [Candidatus Woesearchaeota archaeon]